MKPRIEVAVGRDGLAKVSFTFGTDTFECSTREALQMGGDLVNAVKRAREHNKRVLGEEGRLPEGPGHALH